MPETEALARNLKKIRKEEMKETQAAFAFGCGLSKEEVSLMERKKTDPKLSTLKSIAAYTNHSVAVMISGGQITSVIVVTSSEDASYLTNAQGVIDDIISQQNTDVDTVTGATFSSLGIIAAVEDALSQANN